MLVHRRFYVGVNDRRDMVTEARIYCGNSAISKLFIDRVAEVVLRVLVRRGCDAASYGGKEGSKFLLNGRGSVALRVLYWRGEEHVGGDKVGCKAGIFLAERALRLNPKDEITLDFPDMDNAGGGVDKIDATERRIISNIADAVEEGALDAGVVGGDDRGRKPRPARLLLIRWRRVHVKITSNAQADAGIEQPIQNLKCSLRGLRARVALVAPNRRL